MNIETKINGIRPLEDFFPKVWFDQVTQLNTFVKVFKIYELPDDNKRNEVFINSISENIISIIFSGYFKYDNCNRIAGDFQILVIKRVTDVNPKLMLNQISALASVFMGENAVSEVILFEDYIVKKEFNAMIIHSGWKSNKVLIHGPHIESTNIDMIQISLAKIDELPNEKNKRYIYKSLFWLGESRGEKNMVVKFIKMFIALESLCKEKELSTLDSIANHLNNIHNIQDSKSMFNLGVLARLRALVFHHGRNPSIDFEEVEFVQFIYEDILCRMLSLVSKKSEKFIGNEKFFANLDQISK